ncbi:MAG: 4-hydroxythreonine-4-phosphate dehydrogenase PdxA [Burkholderiales bacterium]|nr:4-hydroxythreonine-4-phosphate dehydrogenase PdxA [Burkholderiales bacterium]
MGDALPTIAAMIGDPAGIGPEVCVKAVASGELAGVCRPLFIGELAAVQRAARISGIGSPVVRIAHPKEAADTGAVNVLDPGNIAPGAYTVGAPSAAAGRAVVDWIRLGERLGGARDIDGLVLGPVDSSSLKLGGVVKDIDELQPPGTYMFRISGALRAVPISEHIRLRDVVATVTPARIVPVIRMVDEYLRKWGLPHPRIGVAGLNPHAMFEEDRDQVAPAVEAAKREGIDVAGPISPDSVFRLCLEGRYDAVVTMYHDQGQIAVKTTAFAGACTIYMGLPFVMLNVPHGTAFDIAGQGKAQHESILTAMKTAAALASGKGFLAAGTMHADPTGGRP